MKEEVEASEGNNAEKIIQEPLQLYENTDNSAPSNLEDAEDPSWSKHLTWIEKLKLSLGRYLSTVKSYLLTTKDGTNFRCSSKKLLTAKENLYLTPDLPNKYIFKRVPTNVKTVFSVENEIPVTDEPPSTSSEYKTNANDLSQTKIALDFKNADSNLNFENMVSNDTDGDDDSIVIAYLRDKDSMSLDKEISLPDRKSILSKVPKMETIPEELSESSLDVHIPSYPGSPRSLFDESEHSSFSLENYDPFFGEAIDFLHEDKEFLIAAETGNVKVLDILLRKGVNLEQKDHLGRNALHLAVCSGNEDAVIRLLKTRIKTNVKDNLGMTPLSLCLMRRPSYIIAKLLFDHGAEILPRSSPVDTGLFLQFAMMCRSTSEDARILGLLVEKGALVNDPEAPGGRQALHFAAMSNNCKLICILIELGADLTVTNHRNETPRDVAQIFKCKEAYQLLSEFEDEEDLISAF